MGHGITVNQDHTDRQTNPIIATVLANKSTNSQYLRSAGSTLEWKAD